MWIIRGTKIRAQWLDCEAVALTGMQMKMGATLINVEGVVRHIRGSDPSNPTMENSRFYVECEPKRGSFCTKCGVWEIEVDPKHVLPPEL